MPHILPRDEAVELLLDRLRRATLACNELRADNARLRRVVAILGVSCLANAVLHLLR